MTNAIEIAVTLAITFHTNCSTHGAWADGRIEQTCVVQRICSVDHDLGDGHRLQLAVTNEVDTFKRELKVRRRHHPILGSVEEMAAPVMPPKPIIYPPAKNP